MLERPHEPLLSIREFRLRFAHYLVAAALLGGLSLAIGMLGYRHFENQSWPDAFLNAAMLLGAMGSASAPQTTGGKIFAGCYALYRGLKFLFIAGLLVTPIPHRFLHIFHADPPEEDDG
ncbi:MAG: hypothetical protein ABI614_23990 [Planctomycetota bacterium]